MAKAPTAEVSLQEIENLFSALEIAEKIADGRWTFMPLQKTRRPGRWRYAGGVSEIVYLYNQIGVHVATVHRITMPDGSTPHWHGKGITFSDVRIVYPSND
jgi:hypothetical protein